MSATFGILNPGGTGTAVPAAQNRIIPVQRDPCRTFNRFVLETVESILE